MGGGSSAVLSLVSLAFVICSLFAFIGKNLVIGGWTADSSQISPLRFSAGSFRLFFCILCSINLIFLLPIRLFLLPIQLIFSAFSGTFFSYSGRRIGKQIFFPSSLPFPYGNTSTVECISPKKNLPFVGSVSSIWPFMSVGRWFVSRLVDGWSVGWSLLVC